MNEYDTIAESVIPRYQEIQATVVDLIAQHAPHACRIVDIGCGTGQTLAQIMHRIPHAECDGVDGSDAMLTVARSRLSAFPRDRWTLATHDITQWQSKATHNIALSVATLNNIEADYLPSIYSAIYASLANDGTFIYADFIAHESVVVHQKIEAHYDQQLTMRIKSDAFLQNWMEHSNTGYYPVHLSKHMEWLTQAGFQAIELVWLHDNFAILVAKKQAV